MNMIRKAQIAGISRRDIQMQVRFVSNLFGIAAKIGAQLGLFTSLFIFCNTTRLCARPGLWKTAGGMWRRRVSWG
jgi:hypothetical protein